MIVGVGGVASDQRYSSVTALNRELNKHDVGISIV